MEVLVAVLRSVYDRPWRFYTELIILKSTTHVVSDILCGQSTIPKPRIVILLAVLYLSSRNLIELYPQHERKHLRQGELSISADRDVRRAQCNPSLTRNRLDNRPIFFRCRKLSELDFAACTVLSTRCGQPGNVGSHSAVQEPDIIQQAMHAGVPVNDVTLACEDDRLRGFSFPTTSTSGSRLIRLFLVEHIAHTYCA